MRVTHTPIRNIRVADELWNAAKEKAENEDTTVSAVLLAALERYVKRK